MARKWDMKTWALVALGGAAVIAGAAFVMQAKHAALGRQVHRNVTKFLADHGSQVHNGIISGGLVSTPMKTNIAVNSTVVSMLNNYADMLDQNPSLVPGAPGSGSPEMRQEEQVSTGIGGVGGRQDPAAGRNPGGPGSALRPASGSPQPMSPSTRAAHSTAEAVFNPTETMRDDGGYGEHTERAADVKASEYNPEEFTPRGAKPSGDIDLFKSDGAGRSGPVAGFE